MPRRNSNGHARPGRNRSSRSRAEIARAAHDERLELAAAATPSMSVRCVNGKPGWKSKAAAELVLAKVQARAKARPQDRPVPVRVYECDKCPGWHLTTRPFAPRPRAEGE